MTRIVELCSAANEIEARALCDVLEEAGIQSQVVGAAIGNAAGLGDMGWRVSPRIWVAEEDAPRARRVLDDWRNRLSQTPREPDEDDDDEPCKSTHTLVAVGRWFICGFGCIVAAGGLWGMLAESVRTFRGHDPIAMIGSVLGLVTMGAFVVLCGFLIRKTIHDCNHAAPPKGDDVARPNQVTSRDAFRFAPELLDVRNAVIAKLRERGFEWLTHYSAVDVMHDVYGIEVCGIHEEDEASSILAVLREMFPRWNTWRTYHKDHGRDPGFWVTIQRDPELPDERWETAQ